MKLLILVCIITVSAEEAGFFAEDSADFSYSPNTTLSLRLVQILYRHGDRSPTHTYTNDIYLESDWPQGYGQLSTEGMRQEFELGAFFREAYVETEFLSSEYNRSEIYVRSTSFERTLMSAYSVLSGLFPPIQDDRLWDLDWQPIPVHTVPLEEDYLLVMNCSCPVYEAAKDKDSENSMIIQQTMQEFSEFYSYVSLHSGEPNTWEGIRAVLDPLFCQAASGYKLPDWVTDQVYDQLLQLMDIYITEKNSLINFAYLRGGVLVGEMLEHMMTISKNDNSTSYKLYMYSAHDTTVAFFLTTLGIFNNIKPPYTACVIIELHELQPEEFVVQLLYKNETDDDPYILKLPDCDEVCPLDKFAQIMRPFIPNDIRKACGVKIANANANDTQPNDGTFAAITVVVLLCLIVLMVISVAIFCWIKRDRLANAHDYMPVPVEMS